MTENGAAPQSRGETNNLEEELAAGGAVVAIYWLHPEKKKSDGWALPSGMRRHEASFKSEDIERDKDDALSWFTAERRHMLDANIDEHISIR